MKAVFIILAFLLIQSCKPSSKDYDISLKINKCVNSCSPFVAQYGVKSSGNRPQSLSYCICDMTKMEVNIK